ncbi:FAD-binding oxidoreductase [Natronorarus salvus]|uniref:FAD-binding oxidoreductase n=1 Tax=Natronorarus salvus TaxID=3117733 RepID=UPI002F261A22
MTDDCSFLSGLGIAGEVSFEATRREERAADWGAERRGGARTPDAVVWPESTEDVSLLLAAATDHGVPVTPYAAGTGLEGNAVPAHGGISLDLTRMNAIPDYRPEDLQIDVGPGVFGSAVDEHVARDGLFFPPLPSSGEISTIGGMIATDASGMQTVKYGEVGDWTLRVEAVIADGSVLSCGSRAKKTSSGYNLKELLIGSEGTLGVITEATLRLAGRPEQIKGGRAVFGSLDSATEAITDAIQSGVDVAKIELLDSLTARMANAHLDVDLPERPLVFLEFHANHGIDREIDFCRTVFESHGVERFEIAESDAEMDDLWRARKELAYAESNYREELEPIHPGDITVPISRYPEIVRYASELGREQDLLVPCFGHAGDGNLHYTVLADFDDPEHLARCEEVYERVVRRAIELGGTATGEHGIGQGKQKYLEPEHGPATVETMRAIKRALDPTDTLNPGKVFPETEGGGRLLQ